MASYCCFFCPGHDRRAKQLEDKCSKCGRAFGFPLVNAPVTIDRYEVVEALNRGYYGATYVVKRGGLLNTQAVLKVTPKSFYTFFEDKDFEQECKTHAEVAAGTDHIVGIREMGDSVITFGEEEVNCYFAELDYVEGPLLSDYLDGTEIITARKVAQISVDMFRLKQELEKKHVYHNDLHAGNIVIQQLSPEQLRANAIDGSIRVVAIDLGSVLDHSRSDSKKSRFGDLHWICDHLDKLIAGLLAMPDERTDLEYRLASALQLVFHMIASQVEKQRTPSIDDLVEQISEAYWRLPQHPWRPWTVPLRLRGFGASYNAQTLQPWHVPMLLVDQDQEWLNRIAVPGPQVIVGMRGCGKTIFLRALQFHARASKKSSDEPISSVLRRTKQDDFLGLFVSAQRLLDTPATQANDDVDPFPRLFVAYALEAVRSIMHLADIDKREIANAAHITLASTVRDSLGESAELENVLDLQDLDQRLDRLLVLLSRGDSDQQLLTHPSEAFNRLAESLRRCALCWSNVQVLYLLDDVSTRYLREPRIRQLLSTLIFQSPICAFKMTSEIQTMELGLKTPGENLLARVGRDLSVFDLGSEVYKRIKSRKGKQFVEQILSKRAEQYATHPMISPSHLLGDCTLETIAREIASSAETSNKRKEVYRGITALAHVCVGDIGDIISLYDRILRSAKDTYPIPSKVQSECFQDHCSHRLYDLNRRGSDLKDAAKSFSEASYELLVRSYRDAKRNGEERPRLRQYASIYIRVTTGNRGRQIERLRDIIDAGVFVFAGGSPRSKTRDSDPILQFKLTFRRIYGLVGFIGLSERDRFELSGNDLEEWLDDPGNGKNVLLRNLGGGLDPDENYEEVKDEYSEEEEDKRKDGTMKSLSLFETMERVVLSGGENEEMDAASGGDESEYPVLVERIKESDVDSFGIGALVLGLGFEERTLSSVRELMRLMAPATVYGVQYREPGKSQQILETLNSRDMEIKQIPYEGIDDRTFADAQGPVLLDVTGLAKPIIFRAVRKILRRDRSVFVAHTHAETYYPSNKDLEKLVGAKDRHDRNEFFEILGNIMTGEERPYELVPLLTSDADQTRRRVLYASASPKHERLLSLLDQREFDRLELLAPKGSSSRNSVAREIAKIAASDNSSSEITNIGTNDVRATTVLLLDGFARCYVDLGLNFEVGLTGSKMETVAAGAVSTIRKFSQCWYVRPQSFDQHRFTTGAGKTRIFRISID